MPSCGIHGWKLCPWIHCAIFRLHIHPLPTTLIKLCQLLYWDNMFHYFSLGFRLKVSQTHMFSDIYALGSTPGVHPCNGPVVASGWLCGPGQYLPFEPAHSSIESVLSRCLRRHAGARIQHSSPDQPLAMSNMQRQNAYGTTNEHYRM